MKRYFVTSQESGELCLLSCLLGEKIETYFFLKLSEKLNLITFPEIARKYLDKLGYDAFECDSEDEARTRSTELIQQKKWPCFFFKSDTGREKNLKSLLRLMRNCIMDRFTSTVL